MKLVVNRRMQDQLCSMRIEGGRQMKRPLQEWGGGGNLKVAWTIVEVVEMERKEERG